MCADFLERAKIEEKGDEEVAKRKTVKQLETQANKFLEEARKKGMEKNYLFETTFQRYRDHIAHLEALQECIKRDGETVTKEYVKGRANLYVNPAIAAYNQTAGAADKAAQLLIKCLAEIQPTLAAKSGDGDEFDNF